MVGRTPDGVRREQLVRAAFHRVAEVGFEGLRLRQVADDVGIDHSTLHHHVATRQELVSAVAEYATSQLWSTVPDEPDAAAAMRGHLAALQRLIAERPELFIVTAELDLRARRDPEVRTLLDGYESGWRQVLHGLLVRGVEQDAWPAHALEDTVELLIAAVKGVRLAPAEAAKVFDRLDSLVTGHPTTQVLRNSSPPEHTRERRPEAEN